MERFLYTAWFRDLQAEPDEQDYEWPACFLVEAVTEAEALEWGDHLAKSFSDRKVTEKYLSSSVEPGDLTDAEVAALPLVPFGHEASDFEIGW
jgi:hypothetical protein